MVETDLVQLDSESVAVAEGAVVVVGALAGPAAVVTLGAEARGLAVEALRAVDHAASLLQGQAVRTFYTTHTQQVKNHTTMESQHVAQSLRASRLRACVVIDIPVSSLNRTGHVLSVCHSLYCITYLPYSIC